MPITRKRQDSPSFHNEVRQIVEAVKELDIAETDAWPDLDALSSRTSIDDVHVDPAGIILYSDDTFEGSASVYVNLDYGPEDDLRTTESFIGRFNGHLAKDHSPTIDHFNVDTSPFLESLPSLGDTGDLRTE